MQMTQEAEIPVQFAHAVPAKPLSDFVDYFWYWRGHDAPYSKERIMPMGTVELVINLGSGRTSQSGMAGPRSRFLIIDRSV
jgi:hypothetical protein